MFGANYKQCLWSHNMKNILAYGALVIFLLVCSIAGHATQVSCENTHIIAYYEINNSQRDVSTQLVLVRTNNKVAHQYPITQITEAWELNQKNGIKPTRYFDAHKRAIEYQPTEKVHGKIETDWQYRYQLISDKFMEKANVVSQHGSGCGFTQVFSYSKNKLNYNIQYLPKQRLIKSFSISNEDKVVLEVWDLQSVETNTAKVEAFFALRNNYKATDFADIGDDHTDPFLTTMVTVGFIEAGASGFYQADTNGGLEAMGHHHH